MSPKLLCKLIVCLTLSCFNLFADSNPYAAYGNSGYNNDQRNGCPCGCSCGPNCDCGCQQGGPCNCSKPCDNCGEIDEAPVLKYNTGIDCERAAACGRCGVWLPEDPVLYRNMMADPRQITYSAGWRFNDQVLVKNVIDVSFGDYIPLYRWCNVWPWGGELQIEVQGALWATFDPLHDSSPLLNADYYGGLAITSAWDNWEFRLRGFHISSHIGDEFLLDHPGFDRRNASAEYVDFYASNDITDEIRLYGGLGYIVAQDDEFKCSRFWVTSGTEVRFRGLGFFDRCTELYGEPFLAMQFSYTKDFKHHIDQTYVLGYEWGRMCGLCRKVRLFIEYHDGYSVEGQFCRLATNYFSVRVSYGF